MINLMFQLVQSLSTPVDSSLDLIIFFYYYLWDSYVKRGRERYWRVANSPPFSFVYPPLPAKKSPRPKISYPYSATGIPK